MIIIYQWKPSCKTGSAKWSYDGIAPDAGGFGRSHSFVSQVRLKYSF